MKAHAVVRASSWVAIGAVASKGLALATAVVLAHFLAPADFGVVALATIATDFVALVQDLGLSPALGQHRGDPRAAAASALRLHAGAAVALTLATMLAAEPIAHGLGDPALASLVRALALGTLLRGVGLVPRALLQRSLAFRALALADVAALGLRGAVAVTLAWRGAGAWSIVAGDLTALAVQAALAWAVWGRVPLGAATPDVRAALLRFGRPMTVAGLVVWARDGLSRGIVGRLLGPADLGYFQLAGRLASAPVVGITHVGNRVALPVYAAADDHGALAHAFTTTLTVVAALALPFAAVLFAVAPEAIAVGFGARWAPVVTPLRLLLVSSLTSSLAATTGELFKAVGRPALLLRTAAPHLVLLAIAVPIGARFGLAGVAGAIALVRIAMALVALAIAFRLLELPLATVARAIAPGVASAVLALAAVAAITMLGVVAGAPPWLTLGIRAGMGFVTAGATFMTIRGHFGTTARATANDHVSS
jgi:O-antigen/teichoic acid export membrane protein